ncbi:MAG: sodium:proton exchanger, partial [Candidatus Eisenbacteria bacterium]|nr:sodium:proton exchanger [Candidatus Eisenbacteria bacterium]
MSQTLSASISPEHIPMLLIIGFAVFFGSIGGRIFQKLRIPQVVGYITIGLVAGESGLRLISKETVTSLDPFTYFALGIIGFMIGGELHRDVFRKYGRQFFAILLAEGLGAFILVGLLTGGAALAVGVDPVISAALGVMFGAVSTATAPAATVNVLWEYKTRGVLTTSVFAIVALDDALALILYSAGASVAAMLTGDGSQGWGAQFGEAAYELAGGTVLGVAAGFGLNFALRQVRDQEKSLTFIIGAVAAVIGLARLTGVAMILSAMTLGVTVANLAPRHSKRAFETVENFAPPIYVLFFVLVGAHLDVHGMPGWMWALTLPYILGRSAGKILGANIGGRLAGAPRTVSKYLGLCLFSQGGVAVGLAILASG